jgi:hypothetical protein
MLRTQAGRGSLTGLSERVSAFRPFDGSRASTAAGDGFLAAFAQAGLEGIPAPSDSDRITLDDDGVGSGGNYALGGSACGREGRVVVGWADRMGLGTA